ETSNSYNPGGIINGAKDRVDTDYRLPITDHQPPLLAFAGDPAALGMIVHDALGPDLMEAQILFLPEPAYPVLCRKRGEEGRVMLEITISAEGGVRSAEIQTSSSYSRLDRAALDAAKMAIFRPATEFGVPVQSERTIAYRFELEN
ncbi:energy transducer TonB, partial [bacterium]|nr:energy transducer TonB [bacterium]